MRLLAVFEKFAAAANPFLAFHQDAGKLIPQFGSDVFQQRELVQKIGFDGLLEFCARDGGLQNLD